MKVLSIVGLIFNFLGTLIFAKGLLLTNKQIDLLSSTYFDENIFLRQSLINNRYLAIIGIILIAIGLLLQFLPELKNNKENKFNIKDNYQWVVPLLFVVCLIAAWLIVLDINNLDFNIPVQIFILGALFWYSFETRDLKLSSKLNNELEQKPIIDLFYVLLTHDTSKCLALKNTGKGVAYNIKVESIVDGDKQFDFYFDEPNLMLTARDESVLKVISTIGSSYKVKDSAFSVFLSYIQEKSLLNKGVKGGLLLNEQKTKIIISYENAVKKTFKRIFYIYDRHHTDKIPIKVFEIEFVDECVDIN